MNAGTSKPIIHRVKLKKNDETLHVQQRLPHQRELALILAQTMTTSMSIPSTETILSTFDDLVAANIISFGLYRTIKHDAGSYPVPFSTLNVNIPRS